MPPEPVTLSSKLHGKSVTVSAWGRGGSVVIRDYGGDVIVPADVLPELAKALAAFAAAAEGGRPR